MEESRRKFDLERDEVQRRFLASILGVELKDNPTKPQPSTSSNGRNQTMTAEDIMRTYAK